MGRTWPEGWKQSRVLLINPPWLSKDENIWSGVKSAMPPLALLSIGGYLERAGVSVQIMDVHVEKLSEQQVRARIRDANPEWVGITVMTATSIPAHKIARLVKQECPNAKVVMGGVHAEALPLETLSNSAVDFVVRGDGEATFLNMINGQDPTKMDGISWRHGTQVVSNPPAELNMELDELARPAYHLVPMHLYYPAMGAYDRLPAINMLMTRGCPGKCTFCNSANTTLRSRSAEKVVEEIEYVRDAYGVREIQFYDDTFTVNRQNVLRFCELMVERKVGVGWVAFIRADCFNETLAAAMKAAGCHQVLIGVESGDDEILKNIRKPIKDERTRSAIQIAKDAGLDVRAAFILGNQGDTPATMQRTLEYAMDLDPDLAQFNVSTPYPGTQLFHWAKDHGYLVTEDWSEYELSRFLLRLPTVTEEEVLGFYAEAHRKYYKRPKILWRRLTRLRRLSHIRDAIHAFFFIVLRYRLGVRGEVRADWIGPKKEDYFDLKLTESSTVPKLTFELRQPRLNDKHAYGSRAHAEAQVEKAL